MHIVHYWPRFDLEEGGVVRAVLDLVAAVARQGTRVTLLTVDDSDVPDEWHGGASGVPHVVRLPGPMKRAGRLSQDAQQIVANYLSGVDCLHLHTPWELSNIEVAKIARGAGVPYVVSIHGMLDDWCMRQKYLKKRIFLSLFGRRFFQQAAGVHATADGEWQQARKWMPKACGYVIPLVVDLGDYLKPPPPDAIEQVLHQHKLREPVVLFLSRLHPKKGVETLIDAAAILKKQGHDFSVALAGPGEPAYLESLQNRVAEHELQGTVQFVGMIRGEEKIALYHAAAAFALPTQQENFGIVLAEALACGTPVVTTRGTDIWPELEKAGAYIVERTPNEFADAIAKLFSDSEHAQQIAEQGRQFVTFWLNEKNVVHQYLEMYANA